MGGSDDDKPLVPKEDSGTFLQYLASHSKMWFTFLICIFYVAVCTPLLTQQDSGYNTESTKIKYGMLYVLIALLFVCAFVSAIYTLCISKNGQTGVSQCKCPSSDWWELFILGTLSLSYHICGILWEEWKCEEILRGESPDNELKAMNIAYHALDMVAVVLLVLVLIPILYSKDSKQSTFQYNYPNSWCALVIITSVTFTSLMLLSAITEEYMEVFQHSRHNPEEISGCRLQNSSTYLEIIEYETPDETNSSTCCENLENYGRPLTYPLVIEFYMLASQMLICVSQYEKKYPQTTDTTAEKCTQTTENTNPPEADQQRQISNSPDCSKMAIVLVVVFIFLPLHVPIVGQLVVDVYLNYAPVYSICDHLVAHYAVSLSSYLLCILSLFVFRCQLSKVKEKEIGEREWPDILKDALIIIPTLGNFFFQMFTIFGVSTESRLQPQWPQKVYGLLITDAILNIVETMLTALFLLDVQNRKSDALGKWGVFFAVVLSFWNFLKWGIDSFIEAKRLKSVSLQIMYFNERWSWVLLIYYPLCIFFRFHCAKLFFSLWKKHVPSPCCKHSITANQTVNAHA